MSQNRSTAVMQRRVEAHDSLDDYPTPCWATRALCEFLREHGHNLALMDCREPAANRGFMVKPLREYFGRVMASDVHDYGGGQIVKDYLFGETSILSATDWTITNPPFRLAEQFIARALDRSRIGCAMLVRSAFLEGQSRHDGLFAVTPPAFVLQFVERCLILKGRVIRVGAPDPFNLKDGVPEKVATATSYCWVVWIHGQTDTRLRWLANVRHRLEKSGDYPDYTEQWAAISAPDSGMFPAEPA